MPERVPPDITGDPGSDPGFALPAGSNQYKKGLRHTGLATAGYDKLLDEVRQQCRDFCRDAPSKGRQIVRIPAFGLNMRARATSLL